MWGLNHGFPRHISTPTTPTEIAPTKHSVHLKEQEVSDLRGVFTPMFGAMLPLSWCYDPYLIIPSIHSNLFMNESPPWIHSGVPIFVVCYTFFYLFPHSIIGPIESCSALWEHFRSFTKMLLLFSRKFFFFSLETHKNCGKETTSLCKRILLPSLLTLRRNVEWRHII